MDAKFCGVRWPNILRVAGFAWSSARRSAAAKSVAASVTTLIMDRRACAGRPRRLQYAKVGACEEAPQARLRWHKLYTYGPILILARRHVERGDKGGDRAGHPPRHGDRDVLLVAPRLARTQARSRAAVGSQALEVGRGGGRQLRLMSPPLALRGSDDGWRWRRRRRPPPLGGGRLGSGGLGGLGGLLSSWRRRRRRSRSAS